MTCGIYALSFEGTDQVYIGQSLDIDRRFKEHKKTLRSGNTNYKLRDAYSKYGMPTISVLEECDRTSLDTLEIQWILEFNSVNEGLNVSNGGLGTGSGYYAAAHKYGRDKIIEVFELALNPNLTLDEISKLTKIPIGTVSDVSKLRCHLWLKEEFPEKCDRLLSINRSINKTNIAKRRGIVYKDIIGPDGTIYTNIQNISELAKKLKMDPSGLSRVLSGKLPHCKGYRLKDGS